MQLNLHIRGRGEAVERAMQNAAFPLGGIAVRGKPIVDRSWARYSRGPAAIAAARSWYSARNGLIELARRDNPALKRISHVPSSTCFREGNALKQVSSMRQARFRAFIATPYATAGSAAR
jgi:hypothetical protein